MSNWQPVDWFLFVIGIVAAIPITLGIGTLIWNIVDYIRYRKRAEVLNNEIEEYRKDKEQVERVLRELEEEDD